MWIFFLEFGQLVVIYAVEAHLSHFPLKIQNGSNVVFRLFASMRHGLAANLGSFDAHSPLKQVKLMEFLAKTNWLTSCPPIFTFWYINFVDQSVEMCGQVPAVRFRCRRHRRGVFIVLGMAINCLIATNQASLLAENGSFSAGFLPWFSLLVPANTSQQARIGGKCV